MPRSGRSSDTSPLTAATTATAMAILTRSQNLSTSSCPVAAGVTSMATTMMIPTAWMLTTIVTPMSPRSR